MVSDQTLIEGFREGKSTALKLLFESFYPSVCIFTRKYVRDADMAEDIAQDAFIELWNRKRQFNDLKAIKGFLYTVARNKSLNHIKLHNIRQEILQKQLMGDEYFYELVQEEETYRLIHQSIDNLADQSRKIVLLSLEGFKNKEIAEQLGVSVNTIKTLKKNAYRELKEKLKDKVFVLFLLNHILN